jgi:hypothetical protein
MENYVTLFDSLYLPQGLALHLSMQRHLQKYTLWILCVDDRVHETLTKLALPNVRLLQLSQLETADLKRVKTERSKGEYCWTLTPFTLFFVFQAAPEVMRVTYIDADLWFRNNPAPIFRELEIAGKDVLITDHAYAPEYDQSATSGRFCVQFMTFTRVGGETVRKWWEERCLEWCFDRFEDGKFGDQKYLDDWPERFGEKVHVLANQELALAPWNATRFPYGQSVVWHFHGLKILQNSDQSYAVDFGSYPLPQVTRQHVYAPYVEDMRQAVRLIIGVGGTVAAQAKYSLRSRLRALLSGMYQQTWRFGFKRTAKL